MDVEALYQAYAPALLAFVASGSDVASDAPVSIF